MTYAGCASISDLWDGFCEKRAYERPAYETVVYGRGTPIEHIDGL